MKLDDHNPNPKNKVEVSQQKKQQIEYELIGNIIPYKNHKQMANEHHVRYMP